jgi:hypothetical protein
MKGKTLFLLAAVVLAIPHVAFAGDLKPCICDPRTAMSDMADAVAIGQEFIKPPEGAGTVNPGAVITTLAGLGNVKVAVDAAKADAKAPDTIRFDFTGQGKFSDAFSTPLEVVEQPGAPNEMFQGTLGPATFDFKNGDKVVKVSVYGSYTRMSVPASFSFHLPGMKPSSTVYRNLVVTMICAAEGTCDFGGKSYKVRLLDGNRNFKLGDASKVEDAGRIVGDVLLVDTGDGAFSMASKTVSFKKVFVGQPVILDGKAYAVTINDDASRIQAAKADVPMGMVKIDHPNWAARFIGKKYHSDVIGTDKPDWLPADTYTIKSYGENGEGHSEIAIRQMAGAAEVAAGKTTDVKVGSPLTVGLSAQQSGGNVEFNLDCKDVSGSQVVGIGNLKSEPPPPPKFTVLDSSGKQVYQAALEYG